MGRIILTSFRDARNWQGEKFSIARWQPRGTKFQEMGPGVFAPEPASRFRHLEPEEFRLRYETLLMERGTSSILFSLAHGIISNIVSRGDIVLCCWCYPERQKGNYKGLYCHRILLGRWLTKLNPTWQIVYADGAEKPIWEN